MPGSCLRRAISSANSPPATRAASQVARCARAASLTAVVSSPPAAAPCLENTTFGISFIGGANGSRDAGQYEAMSWNVRLPMTCAPASHKFSTVQAVASSS